jgi:hypothetical protein
MFFKLILFVVPCVSGFIECYYLFLSPDFKELIVYISYWGGGVWPCVGHEYLYTCLSVPWQHD